MSKKNRLDKRAASSKVVDVAETKKDTSPYVFTPLKKMLEPLKINMRYELKEKQQKFVDAAMDKDTRLVICDGLWGSSKAQPLDAKILTPQGWTTMGELKIGDDVFGADGKPSKILGIFPQGEKEIYRVTFSDGSSTECCIDHLWHTKTEKERNRMSRARNGGNPIYTKNPMSGEVRSLKEIMDTLLVSEDHLNHSIPIVKPIDFKEQEHYINPYILGALIGDGCMRMKVGLTSADHELIEYVSGLLPKEVKINKVGDIEYSIVRSDGGKGMHRPNPVKEELKRLDLYAHLSYEKFIPKEYLFDSVENRINLLQGLMDTDGTTNGFYTSFTTTSSRLSKDFQFLIQSLGGTAITVVVSSSYTYKGEKLNGRDAYRTSVKLPNNILPFRLARKKNMLKERTKYFPMRYFESIELVGKKQAQCILVDNIDHLYITDDCIVTHNTYLAVYCALELLNKKSVDSIIYLRAPVEAGEGIGFLPGTLEEKINPYAAPLFEKLDELLDKPSVQRLEKEGRIEVVPPGFIRGRSWACKAIIVDEAANFDRAMLELILSRIGPFCKVFLVGSHHQSDIKSAKGFMDIFHTFNDQDSKEHGIHTFEFNDEEDIVRSAFVKFVMRKLGVLPQKKE